jgi:tRNA A-37 threonylcarbamoyl transferase component Bud32/tetratricopeptide (TPR) repeat protein/TolB-like protein
MADPQDRLTAALADRYRLERELGAGGMATVYLAEDLRHHRRVAVKVLRSELAASLGAERFLREVTIAANLQHPHILPLYDSGEADGFLYYVMPYIDGPTLRARLVREGELPVAEAVRILREVADGVAAAHARGVVHRDLKPENIMLSGRHALVADFGVAKAVSEATSREMITTAGVAVGTPAYMAPEQAAADPITDHRADIYALGVLAYEMLAGEPPFVRATPQAVLAAQVTATPTPLAERRPTVPPALAALVMRCLEKKPADRPQRADEIVAILESLSIPPVGMTPLETAPVSGVRPASRPPARRRLMVAASAGAAAVLLVLVGAGIWTIRSREPGLPGPPGLQVRDPIVVLPFEVQTPDGTLAHLGVHTADRIAAAIEGAGLGRVVPYRPENGGVAFTDRLGRRVVAETGAGTLITGTIAQRGERIEVQARVIRAADLRTVWTLGPDEAPAADPTPALDRIRERVLGALGWYLSRETRAWANPGLSQPPPTLELFRLVEKAHELSHAMRQTESAPLLREAFARDTTYFYPLVWLPTTYNNLGWGPQRDSVHAYLEARRERLSPMDALELDRSLNMKRSPEEEVRISRAMAAVEPWYAYSAMRSLVRARRPAAALEYYAMRDTTDALSRETQAWDTFAAEAYHMMGRFEEELALVRAAKAREPRYFAHWTREVGALAALGRFDEIEQLIAESHALETPGAAVRLMEAAAAELGRHDRPDQARTYAERALAGEALWPDSLRAAAVAGNLRRNALRLLGRYAEVVQDLDTRARAPGAGGIGYRVLAARDRVLMGDTAGALALVDSARTQPLYAFGAGWHMPGRPLYHGAQILALLGRSDEAVALLRQALNNGHRLGPDEPLEWFWAPIRDHPPFQELARIR